MDEYMNLDAFVDFLIKAGAENPHTEWSFVGGKLYSGNSDQGGIVEEQPIAGSRILRRSSAMKQISASVESNFDILLKASNFQTRCYDAAKDVESISRHFNYFAGWSRKAARILSINESEETVTSTTVCLILTNCPIFSTLSRFVASNYAACKNVRIYVDKKYLIPALSFAFFLCKSGINESEISVFPSTHETLPKDNAFNECVNGVIPVEFPLTIVTDLRKNKTSNIYVKKHSARPVLILKSADIDSVIEYLSKGIRDVETLWLPNVVYVEEPVYKKFLDTLKFAANLANQEYFLHPDRKERWNALVNGKNSEGYEVITVHHFSHSCLFIVNYEFTLLDSSTTDCEHYLISILPVRHEAEGANEMNKNRGLCASVWTNDVVQATSTPLKLNYGTIWINNADLYDPSVPLPMWNSHGVGSFSGKRMLFENIETPASMDGIKDECSYSSERNAMLPKRTVSEVLKQSSGSLESWKETRMEDRLCILKNIADVMKNNWDSHFKLILNRTSDTVWNLCADNLRFWSTFITESAYEQNLFVHNCLVSCRSEPVGMVAVLAGTISVEQLFFYVAAALVYGNVVIVGMSTDQRNSIIADEFERLFKKGLVTVVMGTRSELWRQFTATSSISSVWYHVDHDSAQLPLTRRIDHHQTAFNLGVNFEPRASAKLIETFATKAKCVWLPHLGSGVRSKTISY